MAERLIWREGNNAVFGVCAEKASHTVARLKPVGKVEYERAGIAPTVNSDGCAWKRGGKFDMANA